MTVWRGGRNDFSRSAEDSLRAAVRQPGDDCAVVRFLAARADAALNASTRCRGRTLTVKSKPFQCGICLP